MRPVITVGSETDVAEIAKPFLRTELARYYRPIVGIVKADLMRRTELETERQSSWWLSLLLPSERKAINYVRARHTAT
jgi:hypothetical protein